MEEPDRKIEKYCKARNFYFHSEFLQIYLCMFPIISYSFLNVKCKFYVRNIQIFCPFFFFFKVQRLFSLSPFFSQQSMVHGGLVSLVCSAPKGLRFASLRCVVLLLV